MQRTRTRKTAQETAIIETGSTVNAQETPEQMEKRQQGEAIALLVRSFKLPSESALIKALKAAQVVSVSRARRGDILSRLPIKREAVKGGKVSLAKGEVTDRTGQTRDASSLSADDAKAFNALTSIVNAAELLAL